MKNSLSFLLVCGAAAAITAELGINKSALAQEVSTASVGTAARISASTKANGTPNNVGIGVFVPFAKKDNSLFYFDAQVTADFPSDSSDFESNTGSFKSNIPDAVDFIEEAGGYNSNSVSELIEDVIDDVNSIAPLDLKKRDFNVNGGLSFSPRLGMKYLSSDNKWVYDLNAGYDLRYVTSKTNQGTVESFLGPIVCPIVQIGFDAPCSFDRDSSGESSLHQIALEGSATNGKLTITGYGNIAISDADSLSSTELKVVGEDIYINAIGLAPVSDYGLTVDYAFNSVFEASLGGYYLYADRKLDDISSSDSIYLYDSSVDSMGLKVGISYSPTPALTVAVNLSNDDIYDTRVSGSVGYKFGASNKLTKSLSPAESIQQALASVPTNRGVKVVNASTIGISDFEFLNEG